MKCLRKGLEVEANIYEENKGMEDGFEKFTDVVVNGWITTDFLVKIVKEDGTTVCPFICNKRGKLFISEGDYIITEADGERHVCSAEKFHNRFDAIE